MSWSPFVQYDVKKVQGKSWQNVGKDLSGIATEPSAPPQHLASKIFRRLAAGRADRARSGVCGGRGCGEGEMDLFGGEGMTRG